MKKKPDMFRGQPLPFPGQRLVLAYIKRHEWLWKARHGWLHKTYVNGPAYLHWTKEMRAAMREWERGYLGAFPQVVTMPADQWEAYQAWVASFMVAKMGRVTAAVTRRVKPSARVARIAGFRG